MGGCYWQADVAGQWQGSGGVQCKGEGLAGSQRQASQ